MKRKKNLTCGVKKPTTVGARSEANVDTLLTTPVSTPMQLGARSNIFNVVPAALNPCPAIDTVRSVTTNNSSQPAYEPAIANIEGIIDAERKKEKP